MLKNILYKTLISKDIEIVNSTNKLEIGISGKIIFETKNLFHIYTKDKKIKKVIKKNIEFIIFINDKKLKIKGEVLENTLINRIKKMKK